MNKDLLNQLWSQQPESRNTLSAQDIITKADRQRKGQYLSTAIMSITVLIVIGYAIYFATGKWNNFTIGLLLMIGSLLSRIVLELLSIIKKERNTSLAQVNSISAQIRMPIKRTNITHLNNSDSNSSLNSSHLIKI